MRLRDARSEAALADLCQTYWPAIYGYARSRGHTIDQAEDVTQGFFTKLLEKDYVGQANQKLGRFRTFLLTSFENYLANEWDRTQAQKRGGGLTILSIDAQTVEGGLVIEPVETMTPEAMFARQWARTLLDRVLERLTAMERPGNPQRFDSLKRCLMGTQESTPYRALAGELGISEGAVRVSVHRLRRRFGELLRKEVAETVDSNDAISEEISFLIEALGARPSQ